MGLFDTFIYKKGKIVNENFIKRIHRGVPDQEGDERENIRNNLAMLRHCKPCTALSGCYFANNNKPKTHFYCDCNESAIETPYEQSVAERDIRKFSEYVFNEKYKVNGKNKLFWLLGFHKEDSAYLKSEYEKQAKQKYLKGDYTLGKLDNFGQRINVTIDLATPTHTDIKLITGWMVHPLGKITCTTPLGR